MNIIDMVAGEGLFASRSDSDFCDGVRIGEWGEMIWGENLDLCADASLLTFTGKSPEDISAPAEGAGGGSRQNLLHRTTSITEVCGFWSVGIHVRGKDEDPVHVPARYAEAEAILGVRRLGLLHRRVSAHSARFRTQVNASPRGRVRDGAGADVAGRELNEHCAARLTGRNQKGNR